MTLKSLYNSSDSYTQNMRATVASLCAHLTHMFALSQARLLL